MVRKAGYGIDATKTIALLEAWLLATDPLYVGLTGFNLARHQSAVCVAMVPIGTATSTAQKLVAQSAPHSNCPPTCKVCCVVRVLSRLHRHVAEQISMPMYKAFADALEKLRESLEVVVATGEAVEFARPRQAFGGRWSESFPAYVGAKRLVPQAIALSNDAAFLQPLVRSLATSPDVGRAAEEGRAPGLLLDEIVWELKHAFTPREMADLVNDGAGGSVKERAQRFRVRLNGIRVRRSGHDGSTKQKRA